MTNTNRPKNGFTTYYLDHLKHDGRKKHQYRINDTKERHGLCITLTPENKKYWIQVLHLHDPETGRRSKRKYMGLGAYPDTSLKKARKLAKQNLKMAKKGLDPAVVRKRRDKTPAFKTLAMEVQEQKAKTLRNGKDAKLRLSRLEQYVLPAIGEMKVTDINVRDVKRCTDPLLEDKKYDVANKVRIIIAQTFDLAVEDEYRFDNPARKYTTEKSKGDSYPHVHHAVAADTMRKVLDSDAQITTKMCFEWIVLTGARSGVARKATWDEVDAEKKMWVVPEAKTKNGIGDWRVPLSPRCLQILEESRSITCRENPLCANLAGCDLLFPNLSTGKVLSDAVIGKLLKSRKIMETNPAKGKEPRLVVPHGFRSTLNGWLSESASASQKVIDAVLDHVHGTKVQRSYDHSDVYAQRVPIMDAWCEFLYGDLISTQEDDTVLTDRQ